jgi:hypothetical protein
MVDPMRLALNPAIACYLVKGVGDYTMATRKSRAQAAGNVYHGAMARQPMNCGLAMAPRDG